MMVGRTVYEATPELPETPDPTVMLEVRHLEPRAAGARHQLPAPPR